ncbi:hypothetical protein AB0392_48870 [Nonomuraea angiospora]|uniref:hypothetical protein n=1 Tax=Nonomuraea angiospora TaxID=46172 RepID=UPI00344E5DB7
MPPATETTQLSPEMALIVRYRKREGTPDPELKVRQIARHISRASGHKFGEQYWRRRESGDVTDISDKDVAWMAWAVGVPADELAATGRTDAADLLRQIRADQEAKGAQEPDRVELSEGLEHLVHQRMEEVRKLPGVTKEDCARIEKFLRERVQQALDDTEVRIDMLTRDR